MATIGSNTNEKIFQIKRWLGLNENPDGDTKLKNGEAAYMRNFKVTRDGNLTIRPGFRKAMGLCQSYTMLVASTEETVRVDVGVPSTIRMWSAAAVTSSGGATFSGTEALVTPDNWETYVDYYCYDKSKWYKFVRIEQDGNAWRWIMKRFRAVSSSLNPKVVGLWHGMVKDHDYVLAACDGKLWNLCKDGVWSKTEIGSVDTTGTVHIFGFAGDAWILDGKKYRSWDGTTYVESAGYVPLVVVSSPPAGGGTTLEQVNKLTVKRRVQFSPDGTSTVYQLPEKGIASVDSVKDLVSSSTISDSYYTVNTTNGTVTFDNSHIPASGTNTYEIEYSMSANGRAKVEKMRFAELFNGAQDTRVFLYGDGTNQVLYSGLDTNGTPRADYFPDLNVANIGTENTPVTALIRHYSRLVAFKTDSTYGITYGTINLEDGSVTAGFYISPVNRTIGNAAPGQARLVLNSPRTIHGSDCYEWKNNSSYSSNLSTDERQAKRISDRVYATLAEFTPESCVCWDDDYNQEYYVACGGKALVHNYAADAWYLYTDIKATCFMSAEEIAWFGDDAGNLWAIDPEMRRDDDQPIDAYWESGSMDFGMDFRRKYSAQIWVGLKPTAHSELTVTVQTDKKSLYTEKVISRKMATFADADFSDWSFSTNYKPFMQRLKIKAKKFTYYKMIFKSLSDTTTATVVAVDMRVRFNGYVK